MPIYEFKCQQCGNVFEIICLRSGEEHEVNCPSCGGKETEKMLSTFSSYSSKGLGLRDSPAPSSCAPTGGFS